MSIVNKEILEQAKVEGKFFDLRTGEIVDELVEYGRYPIRELTQIYLNPCTNSL